MIVSHRKDREMESKKEAGLLPLYRFVLDREVLQTLFSKKKKKFTLLFQWNSFLWFLNSWILCAELLTASYYFLFFSFK